MVEIAKKAGISKIKKMNDVSKAVPAAYALSEPGDIILLSPAAASWDQYENFEVRGDTFISAVQNLKDVHK
jgi:UDP-N-acetylmuramoylalanine-D-glutamate ligase